VGAGARPLREALLGLIEQVPEGRVTTFGDLAAALGDPAAARAVARMLVEDALFHGRPVHRVVRADGSLGGGDEVVAEKASLLTCEAVHVAEGRVSDLDEVRFQEFTSDRPLEVLRAEQERLRSLIRLETPDGEFERYVGVDAAYSGSDIAYVAVVVMDASAMEVLEERVVRTEVDFPYIPTYLAFREMPAIEGALEDLTLGRAVVFIDGQGTLHPRGFGIACHVGAVLDIPTVGVAKSLLCGTYDEAALSANGECEVELEGIQGGWALLPQGVKKPVFVSPGNKVSMGSALELTKKATGHRQPLPLELAHANATSARRRGADYSTMLSRP
jgi:deoxyribonuclease V